MIAVDRDAAAVTTLTGLPRITASAIDIERDVWPFEHGRFDAIVVVNYLHRPLFPYLAAALASDGVLIYETFARGNECFGKPSNPDFLLKPDELREEFCGALQLVAFEQGEIASPGRSSVVQRLCAVGAERRWPPVLDAGVDTQPE